MNFLDAAYNVLLDARKPLHSKSITNLALEKGLLNTSGLTPAATMAALLYLDVKKEKSRFVKTGKNTFALKEQPSKEIVRKIEAINKTVRKQLKEKLLRMDPKEFEIFVTELLVKLGFEAWTTQYSNDGGIDVRGVMNVAGVSQVEVAVQVKRWQNNVQRSTVQGLRGALKVHEQGVIITTGGFSKGARDDAVETGKDRISLIDGEQLLDLLFKQQMGVSIVKHQPIYSLDEDTDETQSDEDQLIIQSLPREETTLSHEQITDIQYPVKIKGSVRGREHDALLLNPSGEIQYQGETYSSPSGAARAATGWKAGNGWSFWRFFNKTDVSWQSIEHLRPPAKDDD